MKYLKITKAGLAALKSEKLDNKDNIMWKNYGFDPDVVSSLTIHFYDADQKQTVYLPISNESKVNGILDSIRAVAITIDVESEVEIVEEDRDSWQSDSDRSRNAAEEAFILKEAKKLAKIEQIKNKFLDPDNNDYLL